MTSAIIFIFGLLVGSFLSVVFSRLEIDDNSAFPKKGRSRRGQSAALRTSSSRKRGSDSRLRGNGGKGHGSQHDGSSDSLRGGLNTIVFGRSRCDHCGKQIDWHDNIPLVSYIALRGRCRHCGKRISHYHPVLELCAGLSLVAAYLQFGLTPLFFVTGFFSLVMLLIFSYDLKHSLIPNVFVLPAIAVALLLLVFQYFLFYGNSTAVLTLWSPDPVHHLLSALAGGGFFLVLSLLSRGTWVGGGDIKLGLLIGLLLGWPYVIGAFILAYVIGTVYSIGLLLSQQASLKSVIPFGPMLVTSFFIMAYYGDRLIEWYEGWFLG